MGLAVVSVASGGLPVVEVTTAGLAVTEAAGARGIAVTKVVGKPGLGVTYVSESGAVVPPITPVTWDSATSSNVTLSGGNLVATNTTGGSNICGARVPGSFKSSGKYYFEATITTFIGGSGNGVGIALASVNYGDMSIVASGYNMVRFSNGTTYANGSLTGTGLGARSAGDVIGVAIDLDNRQSWFRVAPSGNWNGSGTANPATNVGGIAIPAGAMCPFCNFGGSGSAANNVTTANFGASAFSGAVPSGFTAGWPV